MCDSGYPPTTPHHDSHPSRPMTSTSVVDKDTSQHWCLGVRKHAAPLRRDPERAAQVARSAADSSTAFPVLRREQHIKTKRIKSLLLLIYVHRKAGSGSDWDHHPIITPDPFHLDKTYLYRRALHLSSYPIGNLAPMLGT